MKNLFFYSLVCLFFVGCGGRVVPQLSGSEWRVAELRGETLAMVDSNGVDDGRFTVSFWRDSTDGLDMVKVRAVCNSVSGRYGVENDGRFYVRLDNVNSACIDREHTLLETKFVKQFGEADFYEMHGDTLVLIDGLIPVVKLVKLK